MLEEFKKFILRGNVLDLAIGVIIGGAFGKIVSSLVDDVLMPVLGIFMGGINFTNLKWHIRNPNGDVVSISYGSFIQSIVDFLIIGLSIFVFIKLINSLLHKKEKEKEESPKVPSPEEELLMEIRDLLKDKV
ncbi:large-conductance mechanosensitive channel protein MscL [Irregularibacter muris]|uniref:Large-conductance mechanosensitive channel n=1 Tax=Irregularibacter muris TaxID=1796619 RepID=A0AAE3L3M9_9FIRM|nr:large-conductance mechanosensitive channel protein MscL [Irregularibacter muris]MCR1898533.1 large-conductance mechanosensitive channel protein MscL [Irregularibacter muris]